ncbi:MAG: hypothetical protein K6T81_01055 [Alicyclobacillus macrosporangiidus]|uniref:hypothetical protein n=1 Tax=Alicyclobacillus macrosporangiidus TaxID=392015 RepID=UPI0026EAAAE9|nr:hypothetical protein [Alicyclobacillus macrosporangiidus]MCL6597308.1 hypothetical protein [Alicyclobacillus macrosporangiidus]
MRDLSGEHLSVAKALYQLDFYLQTLELPFTVRDLYRSAYERRRGDRYDDRWLDHLAENPDVAQSLDEPFTTSTIVETLMRTGHEPIVRALVREVRRADIRYVQAYLMGTPRTR